MSPAIAHRDYAYLRASALEMLQDANFKSRRGCLKRAVSFFLEVFAKSVDRKIFGWIFASLFIKQSNLLLTRYLGKKRLSMRPFSSDYVLMQSILIQWSLYSGHVN